MGMAEVGSHSSTEANDRPFLSHVDDPVGIVASAYTFAPMAETFGNGRVAGGQPCPGECDLATAADPSSILVTFGHGTASQRELTGLLDSARVRLVVDVRRSRGAAATHT